MLPPVPLVAGCACIGPTCFKLLVLFACAGTGSDYANEKEVGEGLAAAITELGIPRSEIFITSKLWNSNHRWEGGIG